MTRLASAKNYEVTGYDLNYFSLFIAKLLSLGKSNINYLQKDFSTLDASFDIITATSLLSVMPHKKEALTKLISLLNEEDSTLILIEPTEYLTVENVWKHIDNLKTFWHYKGLLLWAKAREGKQIDESIFDDVLTHDILHSYELYDMIRISYINLK